MLLKEAAATTVRVSTLSLFVLAVLPPTAAAALPFRIFLFERPPMTRMQVFFYKNISTLGSCRQIAPGACILPAAASFFLLSLQQ